MNRCGGRQFNLLSLLFPSLDEREVLHDGGAGVRTEVDGCLVAHPAVDSPATAVDPQSMLETKVLWGVQGNAKSSTEEKVSIYIDSDDSDIVKGDIKVIYEEIK